MAKKYVTVTLHLHVGTRVSHVGTRVSFFDDNKQRRRAGVIIVDDKDQATAVVKFNDSSSDPDSDGEPKIASMPKSKLRTVVVKCYYK